MKNLFGFFGTVLGSIAGVIVAILWIPFAIPSVMATATLMGNGTNAMESTFPLWFQYVGTGFVILNIAIFILGPLFFIGYVGSKEVSQG